MSASGDGRSLAQPCRTPLVSVVLPVRNEARFIGKCLESTLAALDFVGVCAEVLVVDGASTDDTASLVRNVVARDARVRLLDNPAGTTPVALNIGIRDARGAVIIRLDGHARFPQEYFLTCLAVLFEVGASNVGGFSDTSPRSSRPMARALAATTSLPIGVGAGFRTGGRSGPADTVPFGCFRRSVFHDFGWFDERLTRGQDFEFNQRILRLGGSIWRDTRIRSEYFQLDRLGALLEKQLRRQGPGVAAMWWLAPWSVTPRHLLPALLVLGVGACLAFSRQAPVLLQVLLWCGVLYESMIAASAFRARGRLGNSAAALLPLTVTLYHLSYGIGIVAGIVAMPFRMLNWGVWRRPWPGASSFRALTSARQ